MMNKARIAVFVSGGGTNLEALLNAQEKGEIPHGEIVLVCASNETAYALTRAANHGVPGVAVPRKGKTQMEFEQALSQHLADHQIDIIVLAGFLSILSADFVKQWPERIVNVHPSLIPSFCGKGMYGLKVHEAALEYGVKVTGATVHLVNEIPDGGRILLQKAIEIKSDETAETLQRRVMEQAEWILLPRAVEMLSKDMLNEKENK